MGQWANSHMVENQCILARKGFSTKEQPISCSSPLMLESKRLLEKAIRGSIGPYELMKLIMVMGLKA